MANHYYSENQDGLKSNPQSYVFNFKNQRFIFKSDAGVFSKNYIDFGSYVLLKTFSSKKEEASLIDVGCGYGPIGITIAKLYPKFEVTMVDVNERAISLALENAKTNQVTNTKVYKSYIFDNVNEDLKFDYVLTNPPIRAGKQVVHGIYDASFDHLNEGGELWVVIQKKQGAPSSQKHIEEVFGNCEIVDKEKGYYILKAIKK